MDNAGMAGVGGCLMRSSLVIVERLFAFAIK
jgi:hypothetical protein